MAVNKVLKLPPWKVPDAPLPSGTFLGAVSPGVSMEWQGNLPRASLQPNYPIVWTPDGYKPWNFNQPPYYVGKNLKTTAGYVIRRPRVLVLAGADASVAWNGDTDFQALADQGNLLILLDAGGFQNNAIDSTFLGLPNHAEVTVTISGPFGSTVNFFGACDPTKFTGGDFFTVFYGNSEIASTWSFNSYDWGPYLVQVGANVQGAAPAFGSFDRLNLAGPAITGVPTLAGFFTTLMAALGPYGTRQNVSGAAQAKTLALAAIKTFFGLS